MNTEPHEPLRQHDASDAVLRAHLRASLSGPPEPALESLEDQVLAEWQLRQAAGGPVPQGSGSLLAWGWRTRPVLGGLVLLVLVAAMGLHQTQKNSKALMDELAEPDVLSLISLGEL